MSIENNNDERRSAPRRDLEETLFIESVSSEQLRPMEPSTANTVNVSANGMQVELDFPVLEDSDIALWINDPDGSRSLVGGTIRWVRDNESGGYLVGIELDDDSTPTVQQWLKPN